MFDKLSQWPPSYELLVVILAFVLGWALRSVFAWFGRAVEAADEPQWKRDQAEWNELYDERDEAVLKAAVMEEAARQYRERLTKYELKVDDLPDIS